MYFFQDYDQDREDGGGGIDLVKEKKVLKAEDKFDKELKKEQKKTQKRLLKESKHSSDKRNAGSAKLVRFTLNIKKCSHCLITIMNTQKRATSNFALQACQGFIGTLNKKNF